MYVEEYLSYKAVEASVYTYTIPEMKQHPQTF